MLVTSFFGRKCKWLIFESFLVDGMKSHLTQLCEIVRDTVVGGILESVKPEECDNFFRYYLHDFVRSVHFCSRKNQELNSLEHKVS
jgi:hypothetical protein